MSRHDDDSVTPERFALVRRTFEAALDHASHERLAFLEGLCQGDRQLLDEVVGMLAHDERAGSRLDSQTAPAAHDWDRLASGSVIADRYRMGSFLGRGGMGEVYLAQDLILNQPVALKFLSSAHASDATLKRFRNEVRLARQVSHPNVCRVYDVGFFDGGHFLSMEYIDGEDLSSLLRRVGRLPDHHAIALTRKICAGLHAAHDRGVLHRDLKPANIMIDAGGQPHITDFGVAALAHDVSTGDTRSGTPAYMSPEQKAGIGISVRSDLYSLGVILREMFAGSASPDASSNGSGLREVDPAVDRIILRCLEEDPGRRPRSALEVAMAMPGGDPIAAAMAAGETPSPETVAASERIEGLSTRTAVLCMAGIVVAAVLTAMFSHDSRLLRVASLDISAENLAFQSTDILRRLGYATAPVATAYGFDCCDVVALRDANRFGARERDERLARHQPPIVTFWYRQHQDLLFEVPGRRHLGGIPYSVGVGYDEPANDAPGMVRLKLDAKGRLLNLEARPAFGVVSTEPRRAEDVWAALFQAAGLDLARFTRSAPRGVPSMAFDARAAWTGAYAADRTEPVQVEAAAWEGRPVHFSVAAADGHVAERVARPPALVAFLLTLMVLTSLAAGFFAVRNVRTGRGDRQGALTVAIVSAASMMGGWAFGTTHVAHSWELALILGGIGRAASVAGLLCIAYLAVEPYVRRYWPESLISWNRLRRGSIGDPLVASHILAGIAAWMVMSAITIPLWQLRPVWAPELLTPLEGSGQLAAFLAQVPAKTLAVTLSFLVIVVVLRVLTRRRMWVADVLACVVFAFTGPLDITERSAFVLSVAIVVPTIYVTIPWLIGRFGLVALVSAWMVRFLVLPLVPGSWHSGRGFFVALIPVAIAAWATWVVASSTSAPRSRT